MDLAWERLFYFYFIFFFSENKMFKNCLGKSIQVIFSVEDF